MSRSIKEIYASIVEERNKRLELTEFKSDSKLSVMNGLSWAFASVIHSFETLFDVLTLDISNAINSRINGTPHYYASALLQYQRGDQLSVRPDGLAFGYENIDETKRIITQVSYAEASDDVNVDNKVIFKVAQGESGNLSEIDKEDLVPINAYIKQIAFAGTRIEVVSQKGDILIPKLTVYYDGSILESEMYDLIDQALKQYITNVGFDANVYESKVIEAIRSVNHVTDVYIDRAAVPAQGVFIAPYNTDGTLQPEKLIERVSKTESGYLRESSGTGAESAIPNFKQSIKLIVGR